MKDFFNRKNVAVTITLVVIAIALVIGFTSAPKQAATSTTSQTAASASSDAASWAKKNYGQYEDFLEDDADLFSDTTLETFAKYNAQLDYTYGSIMGLVTTDSLDGKTMEDYAMDESADLELGDSDMLLLIDTDTEQWYPREPLYRKRRKQRDGALQGASQLVRFEHSCSLARRGADAAGILPAGGTYELRIDFADVIYRFDRASHHFPPETAVL